MNSLEVRKCQADRLSCFINLRNGVYATAIAARHYPTEQDLGRGDALRHCIWQCLLTLSFNAREAMDWGSRHEGFLMSQRRIRGLTIDSVMDLHNNRVGRAIGNEIRKDWFVSQWAQIAAQDRCLVALAQGRLRVIVNHRLVPSKR